MNPALVKHCPSAAQAAQSLCLSAGCATHRPHAIGQWRRTTSGLCRQSPWRAQSWQMVSFASGPMVKPPCVSSQGGVQIPQLTGHAFSITAEGLSHSPACIQSTHSACWSLHWACPPSHLPHETGHVRSMNAAFDVHSPALDQTEQWADRSLQTPKASGNQSSIAVAGQQPRRGGATAAHSVYAISRRANSRHSWWPPLPRLGNIARTTAAEQTPLAVSPPAMTAATPLLRVCLLALAPAFSLAAPACADGGCDPSKVPGRYAHCSAVF